MRKKFKVFIVLTAMLFTGAVAAVNLGTVAAQGIITAKEGWTVSDAAAQTMTVSGVSERGVGRVSYSSAPACTPEGSENAVIIPIEGFVVGQDIMSIKYNTNVDLGNIRLFAQCEGAADLYLFAFLNGWNTKGSQSKDGSSIRTVSGMAGYLNTNIMTSLYVAFESDIPETTFTEERYFDFKGIEFHAAGETPQFATDPLTAELGELANETNSTRYTVNKSVNGTSVKFNGKGNGRLQAPINNWSKMFTQLKLTLTPRANMKLEVYANSTKLEDYNNKDGIFGAGEEVTVYFEIPSSVVSPQTVGLVFDPDIEGYAANTGETSITIKYFEIIGTYSNSALQGDSGLTIEKVGNNTSVSYTGAGWGNCATLTVNNYNKTYDALVFKLLPRTNMVLGIRVFDTMNNEKYLLNHYNEESLFTSDEEKTLMYFGLDKLFDNPIAYIEFWFDAPTNVIETPNADKTTVIIERLELIRSFLMPTLDIAISNKTVDFTGETQEVIGTNELGLPLVSYYKLATADDTAYTAVKPIHGGIYSVQSRFLGNDVYKYSFATCTLTINKVAANVPTVDLVTFDYVKAVMSFSAGTQVCTSDNFETILENGTEFTEGTTYYLRTYENSDYFTSEAITFTTVTRTDVTITAENVNAVYTANIISVSAVASQSGEIIIEYKLKTKPDTDYSLIAPTNAGEYDVRITYLGNENYRTNVKQVQLNIDKRVAVTPTILDITINYSNERLSYDDTLYVVAEDNAFLKIVKSDSEFTKGTKLYIKQLANSNEFESEAAEIILPIRTAETPVFNIDFINEKTTEAVNTNIEYRVDGSNWVRGTGVNLNIKPNSIYEFRVRATANAFASEINELAALPRPNKPHAVSMMAATATAITIVPVDGYEYRCGDGAWQDSNVFEGLEANTEYTFFARKKSTASSFASIEVSNQISTSAVNEQKGCSSTVYSDFGILFALSFVLAAFVAIKRKNKKTER